MTNETDHIDDEVTVHSIGRPLFASRGYG